LITQEKTYRNLDYINSLKEEDIPFLIYECSYVTHGVDLFKNLTFEIKTILKTILAKQLKEKRYDYSERCLWYITIIYLEYYDVLWLRSDTFMTLIEHISDKALRISKAAVEGLIFIAENSKRLAISEESIIDAIDRLSYSASEHLGHGKRYNPPDIIRTVRIISLHLQCMVSWLVIAPVKVFTNPNISLRVSETVEEIIHVTVKKN
jgi:hypothetical protein